MTSPTNRTDEVARQIVEVYEYNLQFPKEDRFKDLENDIASAITSAVAEERERAAKALVASCKCDGVCCSCGMERAASIIRQTPTQEGVR